MSLHLTPRLQTVADQVLPGARLADIGTDHAYLPVCLLLEGVIDSAIAADLRPGPLSRAKETAAQYGVSEKISFRLCDGLSDIRSEEVDTIVIAGMGGDTIAAILESARWTKGKGIRLLLQPMTAQMHLRKWLSGQGYSIEYERISCEGKRLYTIMNIMAGEMPQLSPGELWAGRQSDDPLRGAYLDMMLGKARRILEGQRSAQRENAVLIAELEQIIHELIGMKKEL